MVRFPYAGERFQSAISLEWLILRNPNHVRQSFRRMLGLPGRCFLPIRSFTLDVSGLNSARMTPPLQSDTRYMNDTPATVTSRSTSRISGWV